MKNNQATSDIIVLSDVHKTYSVDSRPVEALAGIDLSVKRGEIIAIIGKSGAGKSTLLHILGTIDRPTSGSVLIDNTDVLALKDHATSSFRNRMIGFVFQMKNLFSEFTALENVMLPGLIAGVAARPTRNRAQAVLESVGLSHRASHRPGELSGGEQQRVAIARALLMNPPILLTDEPTGNLDHKTSLAIQDLLIKLCERHKVTMLLVTHDLDLANRLPKKIVMEDGQIIE